MAPSKTEQSRNADGRPRILITGASSGIGMATAVELAALGGPVGLIARGREGLEACAKAVEHAGGQPILSVGDVTDRIALEAAIERTVATAGGLDVAVINAGAAAFGPFTQTNANDFDRTLDTTLRGAIDTIRLVLPHLEEAGGALVVVGSVADSIPLPLLSAYTAAKHGLRGFVDALNIELRSQGSQVTVTLVSPGPVDTPFWDNVATQEGHLPPRLPGAYAPEEVAKAIASCVERERSGGVTVGGMMLALQALHMVFNPISERLLIRFASWSRTAGDRGPGGRAIDRPVGIGKMRTGLPSRPSLLARGAAAIGSAVGGLVRE